MESKDIKTILDSIPDGYEAETVVRPDGEVEIRIYKK